MAASASHTVQACLRGLGAYLCKSIPGLSVRFEWPNGNQKLNFPEVSLFSGMPKIMNRTPELIAKTAPDAHNKIVATEVIGEIDFKLQMDLWCIDKVQRDTYLLALENAINAAVGDNTGSNNGAGLSLQLTDYYNDWVRFDLDGFQYIDDEAAAQRGERRVKIDLLVNARIIQLRSYYAMVNIETYVGATTEASQMTDDTLDTDLKIVE